MEPGRRSALRHNLAGALLDHALAAHADRPALRSDDDEWSYAQLAERSASAAAALARLGVGAGDVLVIALRDSFEWVAAFLGAARIGAVSALASPRTARGRLLEAVARLDACAALSDDPEIAEGAPRMGHAELAEAVATDDPAPRTAARRRDDPCYLLMTSGSTGPPKWAVHRHGGIPACIATYGKRVLRVGPGDVTHSVAPLASSYGLGNLCYFPLGAGACAWVDPRPPTPQTIADACSRGGVTALLGVPAPWARLARHAADGRVSRAAFERVRLAVSAGEPLPGPLWFAVREHLGLRLVNGLGSSEATNLYLSDRPGGPRPGTVGWPVAGYRLRVQAAEGGAPAPAGELWVKGPTLMAGYHGDDAAARAALPGGWLRTGDVVRREADASYTFVSRLGDAFKAGALWVEPARVREVLLELDGVQSAAIVGVEDHDGLTRVVAAVAVGTGTEPPDPGRLHAHCAERLAPHEVPRAFAVVAELPTTPSGKLVAPEMRRLARSALKSNREAA